MNLTRNQLSSDLDILQEYCNFDVKSPEHLDTVTYLLKLCYVEYNVGMRYFCDEIFGGIYQNHIESVV